MKKKVGESLEDIFNANTLYIRGVESEPKEFDIKKVREMLVEMYKEDLRPTRTILWFSPEKYELFKKAGFFK